MAHLISVSRRTDVPAWYGEWFRNRLRAGWCDTRNPFSGQVYRVSLAPPDVLGWVFWSRSYEPFFETLLELHASGQRFLCNFTITGFPEILEPCAPTTAGAVETARRLAHAFGAGAVVWRYDPVLLTSVTPPKWHLENFARLANALEGHTTSCIFSFPAMYRKTLRNLHALEAGGALRVWTKPDGDFDDATLAGLTGQLAEIARGRGMELRVCCGEQWIDPDAGIGKASCVDWPRLKRLGAGERPTLEARAEDLFEPGAVEVPLNPSRKGCGCYKSLDIGAYQTCAHGCVYCYAVDHPDKAQANLGRHDAQAAELGALR